MIKYVLCEADLRKFTQLYENFVHKETDDRIYMRCCLENHSGNADKVCAVLYKDSGIYSCPLCGSCKIQNLIGSNVSFTPTAVPNHIKSLDNALWDFDRFPHHYRITDNGHTHWVNATASNEIIGHGKRIPTAFGRRYEASGKPGFRLFAPVITESLSEAVFLLQHGVNAGSITGVGNIMKPTDMKVYIPQNDVPGKAVINRLPPTTLSLNWFFRYPDAKDIREVDNVSDIINMLSAFKFRV